MPARVYYIVLRQYEVRIVRRQGKYARRVVKRTYQLRIPRLLHKRAQLAVRREYGKPFFSFRHRIIRIQRIRHIYAVIERHRRIILLRHGFDVVDIILRNFIFESKPAHHLRHTHERIYRGIHVDISVLNRLLYYVRYLSSRHKFGYGRKIYSRFLHGYRIARKHIVLHVRYVILHARRNRQHARHADNAYTSGYTHHDGALYLGAQISRRKRKRRSERQFRLAFFHPCPAFFE